MDKIGLGHQVAAAGRREWKLPRGNAIADRTEVFDYRSVRGDEFLCREKAISRRRALSYRWVPETGSGTLYLGGQYTVVKDLEKELGTGLLSDMCKQLGIRKEDL